MLRQLRPALSLLLLMTALTGFVYPFVITGFAQVVFPKQANGSLLRRDGHVIGSSLVGQSFSGSGYFHSRPSAAGNGYDAADSGATNWGPTSARLIRTVDQRARRAQRADGHPHQPVPVGLITSSGSGLDPDLSPAAALYQAKRVAKARHLPVQRVVGLIRSHVQGRTWGVLGEPRVNVLALNLALDRLAPRR